MFARLVETVFRRRGSESAPTRRYFAVRLVLGLLLLAAAGLKLYGLRVSAMPRVGVLHLPGVQMAVVQWEILLGLWLLSGAYPIGSWLAALGTFSVFAGVSSYLGWVGQADCGCFGSVKASPWYAFAVDVLALTALAWGRPRMLAQGEGMRLALLRTGALVLPFLAWTAVLFGVLVGIGVWRFGSADAALAHVRGERLSIRPGIVDVGRGQPGQSVEATVEVVNRTERPMRIIGGTSDCSCVTTADLPLTLAAGEARVVSIRVRLPATPGLFNRKAFFWTDYVQARTIVFPLTGRIDPLAEESKGDSRQ